MKAWCQAFKFDAVIWTNLPSKFQSETGRVPTYAEVIEHIRGLDKEAKEGALEYIRNTHPQIRTPYRDQLEAEFDLRG